MKISELSELSGVPVATVKFYIREGMLPRGEALSATRAEYGEEHLARLRLIAALADVRGLPLARVRDVLALIDAPLDDPIETLGRAVGALPPYVEGGQDDHPRAREAIAALGLTYDADFTAVAQLDEALRALDAGGIGCLPRRARPLRRRDAPGRRGRDRPDGGHVTGRSRAPTPCSGRRCTNRSCSRCAASRTTTCSSSEPARPGR